MVLVVYNGPEEVCTLHITASPLVFPKGEPVEVHEAVFESLKTLADNQGNVYGFWQEYIPPAADAAELEVVDLVDATQQLQPDGTANPIIPTPAPAPAAAAPAAAPAKAKGGRPAKAKKA